MVDQEPKSDECYMTDDTTPMLAAAYIATCNLSDCPVASLKLHEEIDENTNEVTFCCICEGEEAWGFAAVQNVRTCSTRPCYDPYNPPAY